MLAFVDESGDTGFQFHRNSSPYFIVTVVLFRTTEEAEKVRTRIDELKLEIGKPAMEFHFTNTDDRNRQKFFAAIRDYDFTVFAAVCDKNKLQSLRSKHGEFQMAVFGAVLEGVQSMSKSQILSSVGRTLVRIPQKQAVPD